MEWAKNDPFFSKNIIIILVLIDETNGMINILIEWNSSTIHIDIVQHFT